MVYPYVAATALQADPLLFMWGCLLAQPKALPPQMPEALHGIPVREGALASAVLLPGWARCC
jgi:hypothetical protein